MPRRHRVAPAWLRRGEGQQQLQVLHLEAGWGDEPRGRWGPGAERGGQGATAPGESPGVRRAGQSVPGGWALPERAGWPRPAESIFLGQDEGPGERVPRGEPVRPGEPFQQRVMLWL